MRRTLAVLTSAALLGGGAALATAAPSTLSFTSKTTSQKAIFTSFDNVFQGSKKIGTDRVVCTGGSGNTANCTVFLKLPKGTIHAAFVSKNNSGGGPLRVLGGTGSYRGASGTGTFKQLNKAGTSTAVTLTLK
jgi:hypothetical protein